jgi:outer membrane protein OmpA-like peptidoglycan-associated protein
MKQFLLLPIFLFIIGSVLIVAQPPAEKLKQVFLDAEYFYLYEDYNEALFSYNTIYKRGYEDNSNINYRIGQCYLNISGEKHKAIPYLEKASQNAILKYEEGSFKETHAPINVFYFLGNAYRIDNQFDKAISAYEQFIERTDPKNIKEINLAKNEIIACNYASELIKEPVKVGIANVGRPISTGSNDFFPVVSTDETMIVYNSAQKFYDAVFFAKKLNNKWSPPHNITPEIQSDGNQYVSSLSSDGKELFLRIEDNFEANIMVSNYENGKWTKSIALNKNINTKYFEGNACISKDKKTLYFSSNKTGGIGMLDLYKSELTAKGDWGPAQNIGTIINTEYNEDAPFITEDGKRLYFSSQGHNTMGGYDIFFSDLNPDGTWTVPVNIGYPINTADDNIFFQPVQDGNIGYANLYSKEGLGYDDIFKFTISEKLLAQETLKTEAPALIEEKQAEIKQPERELPKDVEKSLLETPITEKEKEIIVLRTLFFDFNSSALTITTKKELDHLAMVLGNFPEIKIELVGNTDALGDDEYNIWLSERRANKSKQYLVDKGIPKERIEIKGFGEKNQVAINENPDGSDNPDGRKLNRRVDIRLLNATIDNIKVEPVDVPDSLKIK